MALLKQDNETRISYYTQGKALYLEDLYEEVPYEDNITYINYWKEPDQSLIDRYVKDYEIESNCSAECTTCQITHIEKYKGLNPEKPSVSIRKFNKDADAGIVPKYNHAFQIECPYIPNDYNDRLPWEFVSTSSEDDLSLARSTMDPVEFGLKYLNWKARTHQATMLRCQSKRKVLRWGRRSGKTAAFAVEILFHAMTRKVKSLDPVTGEVRMDPIKVMVVAPFESQIINVFDMLLEFLEKTPMAANTKSGFRKSPYHVLTLKGGAEIKGFTTGAKSNSDAASLRGQDAHVLVLDEADFMTAGDYGSINPIINSHGDVLVRASSTPKGKRENYYNWCVNSANWKEFYFPTSVIDMTPAVERAGLSWRNLRVNTRPDYSHDEWLQEIIAYFVANSHGVYQPSFVSAAMEDYEYSEMRAHRADTTKNMFRNWTFSIGVDWNDKAGTELCVLGYAPGVGYRVVENVNIPKQDWTQVKGMQAVIELAMFWKPDFVYVDSGHGATNYEMLRLWSSQQTPGTYAASLADRIHKYHFGGSEHIRDPLTRAIVKQPAKAYMVECSIRKFENGVLKFSASDQVLTKQLHNYIVKSRAESGKPIYGMENEKVGDHRLDALNLAIVAFEKERSNLSSKTQIIFDGVKVLGSAMHMAVASAQGGQEYGTPEYVSSMDSKAALAAVSSRGRENIAKRNNALTNASSMDSLFPPQYNLERQSLAQAEAKYRSKSSMKHVSRAKTGFRSRSLF